MGFDHLPVLLEEAVAGLKIDGDGIYVDGTAGGGGHSAAIARLLTGRGRLFAIDRDEEAVAAAGARLLEYGAKAVVISGNYGDMTGILTLFDICQVDGILLDLGVSSHQLDEAARGFGYKADGPLDMRMDRRQTLTAGHIVNGYDERELARIIGGYGEERFARRIAAAIVRARDRGEIGTTGELGAVVRAAIPAHFRAEGGHPAKRTFQALRIACNDELAILERSLDGLMELLKPGGRLVVISFHSLEDRIVKTAFRRNENPCVCPADLPLCACGQKSRGRVVTARPVVPAAAEIERNRRAKSAKMRIFEKGMPL